MADVALSAAERRRPWLLLAPTLVALVLLMIVPILIMVAYSFFTFRTAGVETRGPDARQLARVLLRQLLPRLPVEDRAGLGHHGAVCARSWAIRPPTSSP